MTHIDNRSGLPHIWFKETGPDGRVFDVLVVRGTFYFSDRGPTLTEAVTQTPIALGDEHDGPVESDPLRAVLRQEGDTVLFKPRADLHITGTAHTFHDKPMRGWQARVAVGAHRKTLQLHGPRHFVRGLLDWKLTEPEAVTEVALDYRNAFGGTFTIPSENQEPARFIYKRDNPAGCGWLPHAKALHPLSKPARKHIEAQIYALRRMPAPQIEDPRHPIRYPDQQHAAQGFAPIARWYQPRLRHAGTFDDTWRSQRYPLPPADFAPAFYQSAHPDLILPTHFNGDEAITLEGLLPEGPRTLHLPALQVLGLVTQASNKKSAGKLKLDTVRIDLDTRQAVLVWRAFFDQADPVQDIALGVVSDPPKAQHG